MTPTLRRFATVLVLMMFAAAAPGCKKSVKGEESRWKSANRTVDELTALYPGFRPALAERRAAAQAVYDAAQGIEDEKQRIGKLSEANNLLTRGFVSELGEVDARVKKIRAKLVEVSGAASEAADQRRLDQAKQNVERTLAEVDSRLRRGAPDGKSADIVVSKVTVDLRAAEDQLGLVAPRTDTTAAGAKAAAPGEPAAPAEPAPWTCEYCDHSNPAGLDKCDNCGAARPAGK